MAEILTHLLVTTVLLVIVDKLVRGIELRGWGSAFLVAVVLGMVNAVVRPVMLVLTFPVTVLTFGLFLFVLNACMLWLALKIAPGGRIEGFGSALLGSILLSLLNLAVGLAFGVSMG